jgi:hypothetical protein
MRLKHIPSGTLQKGGWPQFLCSTTASGSTPAGALWLWQHTRGCPMAVAAAALGSAVGYIQHLCKRLQDNGAQALALLHRTSMSHMS